MNFLTNPDCFEEEIITNKQTIGKIFVKWNSEFVVGSSEHLAHFAKYKNASFVHRIVVIDENLEQRNSKFDAGSSEQSKFIS